ncbi:unnamed protein product, partial [Scytosiphon promiscuus]
MADMRKQYPVLVEEASLVSRAMIKVAMSWPEVWHEGLEEASRLYFGDGNVEGMLQRLEVTLCLVLALVTKRGSRTFILHVHGRDLAEAWEWVQRY